MSNFRALCLVDAQKMLEAARIEAEQHGWKVCIAICDVTGQLICLTRMDETAPISAEIAREKAYCSALTLKSSHIYEDMVNLGRFSAIKMPILPLRGGEPIIINEYHVGAIGVSGVKPEQDEQIAKAALAALYSWL